MKEDSLLLAGIEDKLRFCEERYILTNTSFLDMRQRSLAQAFLNKMKPECKYIFWGGYPEAERCCLIFLPDYVAVGMESQDIFRDSEEDNPLALIRVGCSERARVLNHRDYLGSLMALGIKREMTGDILVDAHGADIVVMKEIADFLVMNYGKAGNNYLTAERLSFSEINVPKQEILEKSCTVASLRLDNVVAAVFGIQRESAAGAIKTGMVFVNSLVREKPDMQLREGDIFVLRGKGRARLAEVGGRSRKDRIYIRAEIFK